MNYVMYVCLQAKLMEQSLSGMNDQHIETSLSPLGLEGSIQLEVWDSVYKICSNKYITLYIQQKPVAEHVFEKDVVITAKHIPTGILFRIMLQKQTSNSSIYKKYAITGYKDITIGSSNCTITVNYGCISAQHAVISTSTGYPTVRNKSNLGTYVNNVLVPMDSAVKLQMMDIIFIGGLKIVYMGNFLAVSQRIPVETELPQMDLQSIVQKEKIEYEDTVFARSPRDLTPFDTIGVEIEGPPAQPSDNQTSWLFTIGPSITMPIPMLASMGLSITLQGRSPAMALTMFASMGLSALFAVIWGVARNSNQKKTLKKNEKIRVEAYKTYINKMEARLNEKRNFNINIIQAQFQPTSVICTYPDNAQNLLWNRSVNHTDFGVIRLGTCTGQSPVPITIPKEKFSLSTDVLLDAPKDTKAKFETMPNMPATINLVQNRITGVVCENVDRNMLLRNILIGLTGLHSYTDLKIVLFINPTEKASLEFTRWFPHIFTADRKLRLYSDDISNRSKVLKYIIETNRVRKEQLEDSSNKNKKMYPHYVIITTALDVLDTDGITRIIQDEVSTGFSFVCVTDKINLLPNECTEIIQYNNEYKGIYSLVSARNATNATVFDVISLKQAETFARKLNGLIVKEVANASLPNYVDFFGMLQIGRLEQWSLEKKYKENRTYEGIKAQIGLLQSGSPFILDIHEKMHGPHGLVAGTTGSGKSETLQTAIISWVMNYSPDELALVIIDYKGGGMANIFADLPHMAGTFTNISDDSLDSSEEESKEQKGSGDSQTRRVLISIKSELKRRQTLFKQFKVNHIDDYIKLYRQKEATQPLPHLVLISDEFAELKKEQPEFIKELVSTARVGRSLGIHLILATQKPDGVVDDEIWSNAKFKLCLKVQEKAASNSMLKRPDASYLTQIGRGYVLVGNNEMFELFQSAYSGADYVPRDKVISTEDTECKIITTDGTEVVVDLGVKKQKYEKQLDTCIKYICSETKRLNYKSARQLWCPALPKEVWLSDLSMQYNQKGLTACIGLLDDIDGQAQYPYTVDMYSCGNMAIIGSSACGKSTLLQTMLYSLTTHYTANQFQFYILDFSSRTLKIFANAPQCGGVLFADTEESEKTDRLFQLLSKKMTERRDMFDKTGVGSYTEYNKIESIPVIWLIIDNFSMFGQMYEKLVTDKLLTVMREGAKYGIFVLLTANTRGEIKYQLTNYIMKNIALQLADKGAYREVCGVVVDFLPPNIKGRGLMVNGGKLDEIQVALPYKCKDELGRLTEMRRVITQLRDTATEYAQAIPCIDKSETYQQFFKRNKHTSKIPLGYDKAELAPVYLDMYTMYTFPMTDTLYYMGIKEIINNLMYAVDSMQMEGYCIALGEKGLKTPANFTTCTTPEEVYTFVKDILTKFAERTNFKASLKTQTNPEKAKIMVDKFGGLFVFIDNFSAFTAMLTSIEIKKVMGLNATDDLISMFKQMWERGADNGVYFVIGCTEESNKDVGVTLYQILKNRGNGLHVGGAIQNMGLRMLFTSSASFAEQRQITDSYTGTISINNTDVTLHLPHLED